MDWLPRLSKKTSALPIKRVSAHKNSINIYNKDIRSFITNYLPLYDDNALIYFDPPYYNKGQQLYLNFFDSQDHQDIKSLITEQVKCDWIITYDDSAEIKLLYSDENIYKFDLDYSASSRRKASELMIYKPSIDVPSYEELINNSIQINLRKCSVL